MEGGYIVKPSNGWYQLVDRNTGEVSGTKMRSSDIEDNGPLWKELLTKTDFNSWIKKKYSLVTGSLVSNDEQ